MMNNLKIITNKTDLKNQGFTHTKTTSLTTIIEHSIPFVVESSDGQWVSAKKYGDNFSVTFDGTGVAEKLPHRIAINENVTPLLQSIVVKSLMTPVVSEKTSVPKPSTTFADLEINQYFTISEDDVTLFQKTGINEYVNSEINSITNTVPLITKGNKVVFCMEQTTTLTPEQKNELVSFIDAGLSKVEFYGQIGDSMEDVPGMELLTSQQLKMLYQELYQLYLTK